MSPIIPLLTCVLLSALALIEFTTRPAQLLVLDSAPTSIDLSREMLP